MFFDVVHELSHASLDVALLLQGEIGKEELLRLVRGEELELVRVFDVHYLIADVVRRLNEIDERMAGVAYGAIRCGKLQDAELLGNTLVIFHIATEETELPLVSCKVGREGIFDDACQRAVRHDEAAFATSPEMMREQTERVGVAFEVCDVFPLLWRDAVASLGTDVVLEEQPVTLAEVGTDGVLTTMTKRGITEVVGKASGRDDASQFGKMRAVELRVTLQDKAADVVAEAASHAANLEAVRQAVVHEDAARQRKHLRLVLQASEGSREDKAVVVALKLSAVVATLLHVFLTKAFAGEQLLPLHHLIYHLTTCLLIRLVYRRCDWHRLLSLPARDAQLQRCRYDACVSPAGFRPRQ